jgi:F0F1-type ATP synthase membrane subunit b/b'
MKELTPYLNRVSLKMTDSIASSVTQSQQSATQFQVAVALQKKQLDALKQQGAAVIELLQTAAQLSKSAGTGNGFDAMA